MTWPHTLCSMGRRSGLRGPRLRPRPCPGEPLRKGDIMSASLAAEEGEGVVPAPVDGFWVSDYSLQMRALIG